MPVAYALFGADNGLLYAFAGSATPRAGKLAQSNNDALINGDFDDNSLPLIAADDIYSTTSYTGSWFGVEMSRNGWNPSLAGKRLMMGHPTYDRSKLCPAGCASRRRRCAHLLNGRAATGRQ